MVILLANAASVDKSRQGPLKKKAILSFHSVTYLSKLKWTSFRIFRIMLLWKNAKQSETSSRYQVVKTAKIHYVVGSKNLDNSDFTV